MLAYKIAKLRHIKNYFRPLVDAQFYANNIKGLYKGATTRR